MPDDPSNSHAIDRTRRAVLRTVGGAGAAVLAGCIGDTSTDGSGEEIATPSSLRGPTFERIDQSSGYRLRYRWTLGGDRWWLEMEIDVEQYRAAVDKPRSIPSCFEAAIGDPLTESIAEKLARRLDAKDIRGALPRVRGVVSFVRSLEYETDRSATGETEYPKYVAETLVDGGGDCEDLAGVLAGVLAAPPFGHDPTLVFFSGHVGVGLDPEPFRSAAGSLIQAGSRDLLYLDPSMPVPVGTVPERYRDPGVVAIYDEGWRHIDLAALETHVVETIDRGEPVEFGDYL